MKRSHPAAYNDQDLQLAEKRAATSRAKWTASEMRQLALLESGLPVGLQQKEIVTRLSALHAGRTFDAIKKLRQRAAYKNILSEMIPPAATEPDAAPALSVAPRHLEDESAAQADDPPAAATTCPLDT